MNKGLGVLGVEGKYGDAALIGSQASQPTMGSSTVNCFMPIVRQTFFSTSKITPRLAVSMVTPNFCVCETFFALPLLAP